MRHPADGILRRLLDEPAGVADADRAHVAACEACVDDLAGMRRDAERVHAALAAGAAPDVDLAAARRRLAAATAGPAGPAAPVVGAAPGLAGAASVPGRVRASVPRAGRGRSAPRAGRGRAVLRRPVVAGVAVAAVLAGGGAAAANDWLQVFRTERIAPVSVGTDDLNALPDLEDYGDVVLTGDPDVHPVADAAAAAAEAGFAVPEVASLPRGVDGEPSYRVGGEVSVDFTFSADRAERAAAEAGEPLPPPPPGLDGSRVRLAAGPGVAATWSGTAGGPDLLVGRARAPRAFSSAGVPFETLQDYLLSLPGLPEDVAAPLRTFNADGSTLPLPVPDDLVTTAAAEVDGAPATVLATRDRSLAAVTWVADGLVTVVAGPLDADEVLAVAGGLR